MLAGVHIGSELRSAASSNKAKFGQDFQRVPAAMTAASRRRAKKRWRSVPMFSGNGAAVKIGELVTSTARTAAPGANSCKAARRTAPAEQSPGTAHAAQGAGGVRKP
jgi:hypothetical protein